MITQLQPTGSIHRNAGLPWLLFACALGLTTLANAQQRLVDERGQAEGWYLPVHAQVLVDGKRSSDYLVTVHRDNVELERVQVDKRGRFSLQLDIDQTYTIRITKDGYEAKHLMVDTSLPPDLVSYPDYELFVNLIPGAATNVDPFYVDFPSVIVRWNPDMGGFYHSEHYYTHIRTKLSDYANAAR